MTHEGERESSTREEARVVTVTTSGLQTSLKAASVLPTLALPLGGTAASLGLCIATKPKDQF